MRNLAWLSVVGILVAGCGDSGTNGDGGGDMAVSLDGGDMAQAGGDMSGMQCATTDPMGDGLDCSGTFSCPSGQICVRDNGSSASYHCKYRCDTGGQVVPALCPCDRACLTLTDTDGGVVGAGCILGNTAGERCGANGGGTPIFGQGACAQNTFCAGPAGGSAYCLWDCQGQGDCPAATTCSPIMNSGGMQIGLACTYNYGAAGIAGGAACTALTDTCQSGYICDGTKCQLQCDGPGATCGVGTCTAVTDTMKNKVIGYVCK
jgi:hypothetical protein